MGMVLKQGNLKLLKKYKSRQENKEKNFYDKKY